MAPPKHQSIWDKSILRLLPPESDLYHNPFQETEDNEFYDKCFFMMFFIKSALNSV